MSENKIYLTMMYILPLLRKESLPFYLKMRKFIRIQHSVKTNILIGMPKFLLGCGATRLDTFISVHKHQQFKCSELQLYLCLSRCFYVAQLLQKFVGSLKDIVWWKAQIPHNSDDPYICLIIVTLKMPKTFLKWYITIGQSKFTVFG